MRSFNTGNTVFIHYRILVYCCTLPDYICTLLTLLAYYLYITCILSACYLHTTWLLSAHYLHTTCVLLHIACILLYTFNTGTLPTCCLYTLPHSICTLPAYYLHTICTLLTYYLCTAAHCLYTAVHYAHPSALYQIAHLGDDDEEPEFSSAMQLEEGETFFFAPRPLRNLVPVDEIESLSPIMACQVPPLTPPTDPAH